MNTNLIKCPDCGKMFDLSRRSVCPRCNGWDIARSVVAGILLLIISLVYLSPETLIYLLDVVGLLGLFS